MSKEDSDNWWKGEYPYDFAECGHCASGHAFGHCGMRKHAAMRKEAKRLNLTSPEAGTGPELVAKFMAFRKKFAALYRPKHARHS